MDRERSSLPFGANLQGSRLIGPTCRSLSTFSHLKSTHREANLVCRSILGIGLGVRPSV